MIECNPYQWSKVATLRDSLLFLDHTCSRQPSLNLGSTKSSITPAITASSSMSAQGRKRKRPEVIDGAILAANLAKDAAETISVLAPLKASMGMLTTLLESIKVNHSLN
jgi:hypothetical protein